MIRRNFMTMTRDQGDSNFLARTGTNEVNIIQGGYKKSLTYEDIVLYTNEIAASKVSWW